MSGWVSLNIDVPDGSTRPHNWTALHARLGEVMQKEFGYDDEEFWFDFTAGD